MSKHLVEDLVRRAQENDEDSFVELYQLFKPQIYRYLCSHTGGRIALAEDLTSDVFIRAYQAIGQFQHRGVPFAAWLFRIARNLLIDYQRGEPRQPAVSLDECDEVVEASAEHRLEFNLISESLQDALAELTAEQRMVVVLRFVEDRSLAETARIIGKNEEAVKKLQSRGLRSLRRLLEKPEAGPEMEIRPLFTTFPAPISLSDRARPLPLRQVPA